MTRGPKPTPWEVKVARGTARADRKPPLAGANVVVSAAPAVDPPDTPARLSDDAVALWSRLWRTGARWLHRDADYAAVELACRLFDMFMLAQRRYQATTEPADGRVVVGFSRALTSSLSVCGFDPSSRARLGIAEVRRESELERLIARRKDT